MRIIMSVLLRSICTVIMAFAGGLTVLVALILWESTHIFENDVIDKIWKDWSK